MWDVGRMKLFFLVDLCVLLVSKTFFVPRDVLLTGFGSLVAVLDVFIRRHACRRKVMLHCAL